MAVTGKDVAKRLGVSPSTVSQALNNKGALNASTVALIRRTARDMGYTSTAMNRRSRADEQRVVPVIIPATGPGSNRSGFSGLHSRLLASIDEALKDTGDRSTIITEQQLDSLLTGNSRGVLIIGGYASRETLTFVEQNAIPAVVIASPAALPGVSSVQVDVVAGVRAAVAHLHTLGHRQIGLLNGPPDTMASDLKLTGYLRGLFDANISPDGKLIRSLERNVETSRNLIRPMLRGPWGHVTGVLCAYEEIAVAVLQVAADLELNVPRDLSVVSYHDEGLAELAVPPITTVAIAPERLGRLAVAQLFALETNADMAGTQLVIPAELKLRSSTAPARKP